MRSLLRRGERTYLYIYLCSSFNSFLTIFFLFIDNMAYIKSLYRRRKATLWVNFLPLYYSGGGCKNIPHGAGSGDPSWTRWCIGVRVSFPKRQSKKVNAQPSYAFKDSNKIYWSKYSIQDGKSAKRSKSSSDWSKLWCHWDSCISKGQISFPAPRFTPGLR